MKRRGILVILTLALLLSGCVSSEESSAPSEQSQPETVAVQPAAAIARHAGELDWLAQAAADGPLLAADPEQGQYLQMLSASNGGGSVLRLWEDEESQDLYTGKLMAAGWAENGSVLVFADSEPPALVRLAPDQDPAVTPLASGGEVRGAGFQNGQLCLWEGENQIRWYAPDGQLLRQLHLSGYEIGFAEVRSDAPLLIAAKREDTPLFLTVGADASLLKEAPYPRNSRLYSACWTEAGIYAVTGEEEGADDPYRTPKKLVFFPADGGEMQSRDLTGPAALYSGPSGVLLRYSYSPQDSGKLFAIEPAGFTLTQVDTEDLGLLHNVPQVIPTETGFLVLGEWMDTSYDLAWAALEITMALA